MRPEWALRILLAWCLALTLVQASTGTVQAAEKPSTAPVTVTLPTGPELIEPVPAPEPEPEPEPAPPPGPIFGIDVSNHQAFFDMARTAREGFEFAFVKSSEGNFYADPYFAQNLSNARDAGLITAAYHYQRPGSAVSQAEHIARIVPKDVPVLIDVEAGSGSVALTHRLVSELEARGYSVPLVYIPEWYWRQIGSPDLSGLPPLWYSRWPGQESGAASAIWNRHKASLSQHWHPYDGNPVKVYQFTDSATVAGETPIDANVFRGSRQELKHLLYG